MKKDNEEKVPRLFSVRLHGIYKTTTIEDGTQNYPTDGRCWVMAKSPSEAKVLAMKEYEAGRVTWYEENVTNVEVDRVTEDDIDTVIEHYLLGTPPEKLTSIFKKHAVRDPGMWFGSPITRDGPMAREGTYQYSYDGDTLYSYAMPIAYKTTKDGKVFVILNGDGAPTKMTNRFMGSVRLRLVGGIWSAPGRTNNPRAIEHAFIPFSVLSQARIKPEEVRVLSTTPDREEPRVRMVKGKKIKYTVHFLGETLFEARGKYFVCGLDRNDNPIKRMFYMCQIPVPDPAEPPENVDEALLRLRPEGLPKTAKRQGEWYFVPKKTWKPPRPSIRVTQKNEPLTSDQALVQGQQMGSRQRESRHVVSTLILADGAVYAKGNVRDAEHSMLRLGQTWHKVVKNLAVVGWRYVPTGPYAGTKVD
jgi:hypothetical protein